MKDVYVDRYGFRYSEATQSFWGPRLTKLLGIRRTRRTSRHVAEDRAEKARATLRETAKKLSATYHGADRSVLGGG